MNLSISETLLEWLIMSDELTWQAILFIVLISAQGFALVVWTVAKAIKAWREALEQ